MSDAAAVTAVIGTLLGRVDKPAAFDTTTTRYAEGLGFDPLESAEPGVAARPTSAPR